MIKRRCVGVAAAALLALAGCGAPPPKLDLARIVASAGDLDLQGRLRLEGRMDPASLKLARRFDPAPHADLWSRPRGWTVLALARPPGLAMRALDQGDARKINAALPGGLDLAAAQPFYLAGSGPERARALLCLTQAIYYEAALEPKSGQAAVAQTVLNRVRHPDFPKSVCGVVYQGSQAPGCQFSFACDGSRERPPIAPFWQRAEAVAKAALDGAVEKQVGTATHYHADYVFPAWAPEMFKIGQIGAHIFYRYPGPFGAQGLTAHYRGGELRVSMAGPPASLLPAKPPAPGEAAPAPSPGTAGPTVAIAASTGLPGRRRVSGVTSLAAPVAPAATTASTPASVQISAAPPPRPDPSVPF